MSNYSIYHEEPFTGEPPTNYFEFKYPLDNFQLWGCKAIDDDENVLATAHTGSGKTTLALYAIAKCIKMGKKVIYTSPIKTLSNQKFKEFSDLFPDVGIITGDIKINPTAQCLIMTAEILRNSLLRKHNDTIYEWNFNPEEVSIVILDEVHFINNQERGKVWEEIIINLSRDIKLVMLSATISGATEMIEWIGNLKKVKCHLVSTLKRPVPLTHAIYWDNNIYKFLEDDTKWHHLVWQETKKTMDKFFLKNRFNNVIFHQCLKYLKTNNLLPATVFLLNRDAVESQAKTLLNFIDDYMEAAEIHNLWKKHLHKYEPIYKHTEQWATVYDLVIKGIGIHHSGMIPILKEIVEILYDRGLIKVLLATETFAMGVNMPTKTVIFTNLTKFDGNQKRMLRPEEYGQMAGRAGRRGMDKQGLVLILPSLHFITESEAKEIILAPPQRISSKLSLDYSLVLKLLNYKIDTNNTDDPVHYLNEILTDTLFNNQEYKHIHSLITDKEDNELKLKNTELNLTDSIKNKKEVFLKILKIDEQLTPSGYFKLDKKSEKKLLNEKGLLSESINPYENQLLSNWYSLENELDKLNNEIDFTNNKLNIHLEKVLIFLQENQLLNENYILTEKGRTVSEVNECNPLLMEQIIELHLLDDLEFYQIIGILTIFVADKDKEEIYLNDLEIDDKEKEIINKIVRINEDLYNKEIKLIQTVPFHFNSEWDLSYNMIEVTREWVQGNNWSSIKHKFNNFEGNFIKNILRLTNITRNLESIAKLLNNVKLLNKLEGHQEKLIKDIVITDSLYI